VLVEEQMYLKCLINHNEKVGDFFAPHGGKEEVAITTAQPSLVIAARLKTGHQMLQLGLYQK
jgi:hypothetical protein